MLLKIIFFYKIILLDIISLCYYLWIYIFLWDIVLMKILIGEDNIVWVLRINLK